MDTSNLFYFLFPNEITEDQGLSGELPSTFGNLNNLKGFSLGEHSGIMLNNLHLFPFISENNHHLMRNQTIIHSNFITGGNRLSGQLPSALGNLDVDDLDLGKIQMSEMIFVRNMD